MHIVSSNTPNICICWDQRFTPSWLSYLYYRCRPKSSLERGSTHSASVKAIEETDENVDDDLDIPTIEDISKDTQVQEAVKLGEVCI